MYNSSIFIDLALIFVKLDVIGHMYEDWNIDSRRQIRDFINNYRIKESYPSSDSSPSISSTNPNSKALSAEI